MFKHLCIKTEETGIVENLEEIKNHLYILESKIQRFFQSSLNKKWHMALLQNIFQISLDVANTPDEVQEQFLELQNHSSAHDIFQKKIVISILMCYASFVS